MARKTFPEEGIKDLVQLKVGDSADSQIIKTITGQDPWDLDDNIVNLQADTPSDAIGDRRLFETFSRLNQNSAWIYMGLCEYAGHINRSPEGARRVFICSPFAKDPEWSIRLAKALCRKAFEKGILPIAPHLYFTQFLRDGGGGYERKYGIAAGHEMMKSCDSIHVFVVDGYISAGMRSDIEYAVNALAMQPYVFRITRWEAEKIMEEYLKDMESQELDPAGK